MKNKTPQEKVVKALTTAWNLYTQMDDAMKHPDDTVDFRKCIHDAQRIMFTQLMLKQMEEQEQRDNNIIISKSNKGMKIYADEK